MAFDKVVSTVLAVIVPVIGLGLRASRRNRLMKRIEEYRGLAEHVRARDERTAGELDAVLNEMIKALIRMDRRAMRRRLDPAAVIALLFLTLPAAVGFVLALGWDRDWKWPVLVFTAVWFVVWLATGLTQLWTEREDVEPADGAS